MSSSSQDSSAAHWEAYWNAAGGRSAAVSGDAPGDLFDEIWRRFLRDALGRAAAPSLLDLACGAGVLLDREGRARVYEVVITSAVTITDLKNNKVIYDNQNFVFRDSFEFSEDPRSFFNEEDPAVERMARAFASSVISTIVNGIGVREEKGN